MPRIRLSVVACLALSLVASITGCTKQGTLTDTDTLSISLPINPHSLNPLLNDNAIEGFVAGLTFSELVTIDNHGHEVGDLAAVVPTLANGGISKDGLTITYHLRKNATWHDGVPVTSKDVVFTWHAIMNPTNNIVSHTGYDQIASMDTPDDHTVIVHFKKIFPPAVDTIFGESDQPYRILPAHLLAKYPDINNLPFNSEPIGSGAYKFVRWTRGDSIDLIANPNYYGGAPAIKHLHLKIIADDNTVQSQLRTGEVQLGIQMTAQAHGALANVPNIDDQLVTMPYFFILDFNLTRAPFNDVQVRRALARAIDRASLIRGSTFGTGSPAIADLTPFSWAYDASLKPIPYDPAQAASILDADGWKLGANGIRSKNGTPLSMQIAFGKGNAQEQSAVVLMQQMLKKIGVDVQVKSYDLEVLYGPASAGGIANGGHFDSILYQWIAGTDPDDSSMWMCDKVTPNGYNITRYCSPAMEAAQRLALSTFDRTKRKAAYRAIEEQLLSDVPGVVLYDVAMAEPHITALKNYEPNGISEGWNATQWSLQAP
jgi:peptide/nickel transport system substrate-binding protein